MNTANGAEFAGAQLIAARKMDFGEPQLRELLKQVNKAVAANSGQMPIVDPAGLLALGVVFEKLEQICARLDKLEEAAPKRVVFGPSGGSP